MDRIAGIRREVTKFAAANRIQSEHAAHPLSPAYSGSLTGARELRSRQVQQSVQSASPLDEDTTAV